MESLRQIRERLGISQTEVANKNKITSPDLSKYEAGIIAPDVEDMINLERNFSQRIDWSANETIDEDSKSNIVACINELSEHYPLLSVLRFIDRSIRFGQKIGEPDKLIVHFTKVSRETEEEPLLPTSF